MPANATGNPTDVRELANVQPLDSLPSIDPESANELDKLFAKKTAPADAAPAPKPDDAPPAPNPDDGPKPDDAAPKPDDAAPKPDDAPAPKPDDAAPPAPKDDFDSVILPPYSKPKTNDSFNELKRIAREKLSNAEAERDALRKERDELAAKVSNGLPPETEAELKELRSFRNKLDVEADPEFKTFDKTVADNIESIYSRLKADNFTDAHLARIKELGGPAEVDWESVKMDPKTKRFVDGKLLENENIADKKTRAIEEAKKNADEYLRTKSAAQTDVSAQHNKQVELKVKELVPQLGWLEERKPKDGATAAEKSAVEAHNKLVKESNDFLAQATSDNSPELRSLLAVGYVQLLKARSDLGRVTAESGEKIKTLEAQLKEITAKFEKVKSSSTARLTPAATPDSTPNAVTDNIHQHPASAIDALMQAKMQGR